MEILEGPWIVFFVRWLHVVSGIMWIGLLWYFNFVQIPSMPKIPDEQKPAISKVIAPEALDPAPFMWDMESRGVHFKLEDSASTRT